ncbi:MAG: hypothetical protein WBC55_01005 [Dehalococcoidia bacterium]
MKSIARDQEGVTIPLVLVLMVVGAVIISALFLYLNASLLLIGKNQQNIDSYYAADSGIDYALNQFRDVVLNPGFSGIEQFDPYELNDNSVDVTIEDEGGSLYKIISTATSDTGSATVESYIRLHDYAFFFDGAITSDSDINIQPGSTVTGNVTYSGSIDGEEYIDGNVTQVDAIEPWPTIDYFSGFYWDDVKDLEPLGDSSIDVKYTDSIGPLYRDGSLDIVSSEAAAGAQLNGTVFVAGETNELIIGQTGRDFTIDLNGQVIYVEGDIIVGGKCALSGSGFIIAGGDIDFQPNMQSGPDDFVFVLSIEGEVNFQPGGDFYGSLAGDVLVNLQPNCTLVYTNPSDEGVNFSAGDQARLEILTYDIL